MAQERKTVTVQGKEYPLKTDAERAASKPAVEKPRAETPAPINDAPVRGTVRIPQAAPRQVLLALTFSLLIFLAAGGRIERVIAKVRGVEPPAKNAPFTANTIFAWGFLFVSLMVLADIQATGDLAVAFAWLIFLAILLEFGPQAFTNLQKLTAQATPKKA